MRVAAGVLLLVAPAWLNAAFAVLGRILDYPEILRRPARDVWLASLGVAVLVSERG